MLLAVDAILSSGTFSSLSCVSLGLCGSVVVVELAVALFALIDTKPVSLFFPSLISYVEQLVTIL